MVRSTAARLFVVAALAVSIGGAPAHAAPAPVVGSAVLDAPARVRVAGTVHVTSLRRLGVSEADVAADKTGATREAFSTFAQRVVRVAQRKPVSASVVLVDAKPVFTRARSGYTVAAGAVTSALLRSYANGGVVDVPLQRVAPAVSDDATDSVIVVRAGENELDLYRDQVLTTTYDVATGAPHYPTPKGRFTISLMRHSPTWINPHPDEGWGKSMPASIGPGPTNPLGVRAMNLTAPNIRIHGTPASNSIGYSVSHGCIRMRNADVVKLFDQVGVGTVVYVVQTAPPKLPPAGSGIPVSVAEGG